MEPVQQMVSRYPASYKGSDSHRPSGRTARGGSARGGEPLRIEGGHRDCIFGCNAYNGGHQDVKRAARLPEEPELPEAAFFGREPGGAMLDISGLQRFYYVRNFHDMRCKYDRVLSIIREQFHREPQKDEVFIIMSKDRRKVRLFNYDRLSAALFEKRFSANYRFMKVEKAGEETFYSIEWRDVVMLLENAVINKLIIK